MSQAEFEEKKSFDIFLFYVFNDYVSLYRCAIINKHQK